MNPTRAAAKLFSARAGTAVVTFLGITYFARLLNPYAMGIFFLFEALLGFLSVGADLGLTGAIEKRVSENTQPGRYLAAGIILKLIPLSLFMLVVLIFRGAINQYIGAEVAVYLAIALLLQEFGRLTLKTLNAELNVGKTAVLQLSRQVTWVAVGAVLIEFGYGVMGLIYGYLAGFVLMFTWGLYRTSTALKPPARSHARSLFDYSKYNFVSFSLAGYSYSWIDVALIGFFLSQSAVGAYEIAWRVTLLTTLLSEAIGTTIFPQISRWAERGEMKKIEDIITQSITPSVALVIPATFGVWLLGDEILGVVFGSEYATAGLALLILMIEKIFRSVHVIIGHTLQAIDRPDLAARAAVLSILVNMILNLVLIPPFGIVGAAVATATSFIINTVLHGLYLSKFVTVKLPYSEIGWSVVASTVMTAVLLGVTPFVDQTSLIGVILLIGCGTVTYGVILLAWPDIRLRINRQIQQLLS